MSKRNKLIIVFVVFLVALAAIAGGREIYKALNPEKDSVQGTVSVKTAEAAIGSISVTTVGTGKVTAKKEVNVFPKIAGKADSVNVSLGDEVKKGDVLFTIDPSDISSQINQAGIQVSGAKKARDKAAKAVKDIKKAEKAAKAALSAAEKAAEQAAAAFPPSPAAIQEAMAAVEVAKAAVAQAEQGRAQAESGYDQADIQYQLASEGARAAANTEANLTVKSPISGAVTLLNVQAGGMVAQTAPAAVISNISDIRVTMSVSESTLPKIKEGDTAAVRISAVSDEALPATIDTIVPSPPQGQTTYPVIIAFDGDAAATGVNPGMFAEIRLTTGSAKDVVIIPSDAVMIKSGKQFVAIVNADGKAELREVATGLDDGENIEVSSGVAAGDRVIYEGQYYVNDGSKVKEALA
jgi:RND family efflux transporter MFP subunit